MKIFFWTSIIVSAIRVCINLLFYLCWWSIIGYIYCYYRKKDEEYYEDNFQDDSLRNSAILIDEN